MRNHHLAEGALLDDRYLIQKVLGEGGFGITYAAVNRRINLKVAVKELFWREHVCRASGGSPEILVISGEEKQDYEALKEKFMREARLLRDFDGEAGVVRILDYFEANNTAYLVMEYLEGLTFRQFIKQNGLFEPEDLFRRLLPLMESLGHIHQSGVIHRDISPDNIMVLEDGSLKLLDFGAARNYKTAGGAQYTAIARENYAPGEQFERNGNQGPWTDIYALCATIYEGVTGCPPESSVQRLFLDELKKPSELGISIGAAYEKIIMKGLEMAPANRYPSLEQMKKAVEEALPLLVEPARRRRGLLAGILAGAGAASLLLGIFLYREYDRTHKFRNIATETFRLTADPEMTAEEFAGAQKVVEERLAEMAGEDNYILEVEGDSVTVTLPLDEFEGREIAPVLEEQFVSVNEEKPFLYEYEIQAVWEDPAATLMPGENQRLPEQVEGPSVTQIYTCNYDSAMEQMTRGEWSNLITDMKVRLDCLDTPYAFGLLYGNETKIVLKIAAEKTGNLINTTLGQNGMMYIRDRWSCDSISVFRNSYLEGGTELLAAEEQEDGSWSLVCRLADDSSAEALRETSEYLVSEDNPEIYLKLVNDSYIAGAALSEPAADGTVEFTEFYFQNGAEDDKRPLLEYFCSLVNDTHMPETLLLENRMFRDEQGEILFGAEDEEYYGVTETDFPLMEEFQALTEQMKADGWDVRRSEGSMVFISLGLPVNDHLIEDGLRKAEEFIRQYDLANQWGNFYILLTDEQGDERCRLLLLDSYSERRAAAKLVLVGKTMAPYFEEAREAWQNLSLGAEIVMQEPLLEEET